jgi:TusA-related sulfurtransferase
MTTINTCGLTEFSPLIPAIRGMYTIPVTEQIEVIMDNEEAFHDLKSYLSKIGVGFREIYSGEHMALQFSMEGGK